MKTSKDAPTNPGAAAPDTLPVRLLALRLWVFFKVLLVWVFDLLSWLWLLRIPLLGIGILQLLACMNRVNLIRGAFETKTAMTMFWMSFIVYFFVWAMRMICCLTVRYGPMRFDVPHLRLPAFAPALWVNGPGVFIWSLAGVYPLYVCWQVGYADAPGGPPQGWAWWAPWLAVAAGWLVAYVLYAAVVLLQRVGQIKPPPLPKEAHAGNVLEGEIYDLWLPTPRLRALYKRAKDYTLEDPPQGLKMLKSVCLWILNQIPPELGRGVLFYDRNNRVTVVAPGIIAAMVAGVLGALIFYWFHGIVMRMANPPPAFFYVVWLLAVICWQFGFVAFVLDRWRLPSVCIFIGFFCWLGHANTKDYTFVVQRTKTQPPTAGQILKSHIGRAMKEPKAGQATKPRIILVAAEGGGIHSGTWVTHVLGKLAQQHPADPEHPLENPFKNSIILVSGVSGGSYGLMYWLDSYLPDYDDAPAISDPSQLATSPTNGPAKGTTSKSIPIEQWKAGADELATQSPAQWPAAELVRRFGPEVHFLPRTHAQRDSLSTTVQGLIFTDLWMNTPLKYLLGDDRGTAIQNRWAEKLNPASKQRSLSDWRLSEWAELAAQGKMPAALFNSTSQETGLPVVFGTSSFSSPEEDVREFRNRRVRSPANTREPAEWWLDTSVAAAARMSSSFPWVLPMARPDVDKDCQDDPLPFNQQHLADGGYYDNFGMSSLNRWLDSALSEYEKIPCEQRGAPLEILVVQIWDETTTGQKADDTRPTDHGMIYQAGGPLFLLVNQRSYSHSVRNLQEFNLLKGKWEKTGVARIHTACFEFPYDDGALSWHLTDKQLQQITRIPLTQEEKEPGSTTPQCDCLVNELHLSLDSISHEPLCSQGRNQAVVLQECREELAKRLKKLSDATKTVKDYLQNGTLPP